MQSMHLSKSRRIEVHDKLRETERAHTHTDPRSDLRYTEARKELQQQEW